MVTNINPTLTNLPIECVFRILDYLDLSQIVLSVRDVCSRLNAITDAYHLYAVSSAIASQR